MKTIFSRMSSSITIYCMLCVALLLFAGCGSGNNIASSEGRGSISFGVVWDDGMNTGAVQKTASPSGDVCVDYGIETMISYVFNAAGDLVDQTSHDCSKHTGTIKSPVGTDIRLRLEGIVSGAEAWRGEITGITVTLDSDTDAGELIMSYISDDATPPTVGSVNPTDGSTDVSVNTAVTATFSEAVVSASVSTSSFTLLDGTTPVQGTVSYDTSNNTATFTPGSDLAYNTTYTATLTAGIEDLASNALAADYSWTFTIRSAPDLTAPTLLSVNPADSTIDVVVNTKVSAAFSEAMDISSVNTSTFTLSDGSSQVLGTVSYNTSDNTATFTPNNDLSYNTTYTATLTTGVKDAAGNNLASDYAWTFSTPQKLFPIHEYTVRDWTSDGVGDGYVGAGSKILFVKTGTEDRAVLKFDIYSVASTLTSAFLSVTISTLDTGGSGGNISLYSFETYGFQSLDDYVTTGKNLIATFAAPNESGNVTYTWSVKDEVRNLRESYKGYIGFLFVGADIDRYDIKTTDASSISDRPQLDIDNILSLDTLDATARGGWHSTGSNNSLGNTWTGHQSISYSNSYFTFDLSGVSGDVQTAKVRLEIEGYWGSDSSEDFLIWDVTTDATEVDTTFSSVMFSDLESGNSYASLTVQNTAVGTILEMTLNDQAVSDINAAIGGLFTVGLSHTSTGGVMPEGVRFSYGTEARTHQLILISE